MVYGLVYGLMPGKTAQHGGAVFVRLKTAGSQSIMSLNLQIVRILELILSYFLSHLVPGKFLLCTVPQVKSWLSGQAKYKYSGDVQVMEMNSVGG